MAREGMVQVRRLRTAAEFTTRVAELGAELPFDEEVAAGSDGVLATPLRIGAGLEAANRFCILPMEGWDGTADGRPTELVERRWMRFAESGAGLMWAEATAVRGDGRANPNQLCLSESNAADLARLCQAAKRRHAERFGTDLLVGLQLTHSGRWSRPEGQPAPLAAYRHPLLDARFPAPPAIVSDDDLDALADGFVRAAVLAADAGFDFVDVKHCHGYLLHELLSATEREGRYGGSLDRRSNFVARVASRVREERPRLALAVRLSAFDFVPFTAGRDGVGSPQLGDSGYIYAFGGDGSGVGVDLAEPDAFLSRLESLGVGLVCVTAGSPYYTPHVQRPAWFPPSDGYLPPEDPLVGVARLLAVTAELKRRHPGLVFVGTGYSYLQEWLPNVAQAAVRLGWVDSVGIGRMALSYHDLPADVLAGRSLDRRRICRTFSDCTTGPRNGLVSGCWPLDDFYKHLPERRQLAAAKRASGRIDESDDDE